MMIAIEHPQAFYLLVNHIAMSSATQRAKRKEELERAYELQVRAATWVSFSSVLLNNLYLSSS